MPLVPIDDDMGPMQFASGSHSLGPLGEHAIGDDSEAAFAETVSQHGLTVGPATA